MDPSSISEPHYLSNLMTFPERFLQWMGRLFSTCGNLSFKLHGLISKIKQTSQPVFELLHIGQKESRELINSPTDKPVSYSPSNQNRTIVSPVISPISPSSTEKNSKSLSSQSLQEVKPLNLEAEDDNPLDSIKNTLFIEIMGYPLSLLDEKFSQVKIYNGERIEQKDANRDLLTGDFRLEWVSKEIEKFLLIPEESFDSEDNETTGAANLTNRSFVEEQDNAESEKDISNLKESSDSEEDKDVNEVLETIKFTYTGKIRNGKLQGEGLFQAVYSNFYSYLLLNGYFENGSLISGSKFFESDADHPDHLMYQGSFLNGKPEGSGKLFLLIHNRMQLQKEGIFKEGELVTGCFYKDLGIYLSGHFDSKNESFKGTIKNSNCPSFFYEGEIIKDKYEGQSTLQFIEVQEVRTIEKKEAQIISKDITEEILCKLTGKFLNGKLHQGAANIAWADGKTRTAQIEKGVIINTTTQIPSTYKDQNLAGLTLEGLFELYSMDGEGSINNAEGHKIYIGKIACGYSHGQGKTIGIDGETLQEGIFEYGTFKGAKELLAE